jgi:hypothetical protein
VAELERIGLVGAVAPASPLGLEMVLGELRVVEGLPGQSLGDEPGPGGALGDPEVDGVVDLEAGDVVGGEAQPFLVFLRETSESAGRRSWRSGDRNAEVSVTQREGLAGLANPDGRGRAWHRSDYCPATSTLRARVDRDRDLDISVQG